MEMKYHLSNTTLPRLVCALERWNSLALLLVERVHLHGAVADVDIALRLLLPRKSVLHPFFIVSVGVVFASVCATRFLAVCCGLGGLHSTGEEVAELESLDKIAVPDHAAVFGADLAELLIDLVDAIAIC